MTELIPQRLIDGMRGVRYGEVLAVFLRDTGLEAEVYGTQMLNDCPQELWETLDADAIAKDMGAVFAKLNGPRYWLLDGLGSKVAVVDPVFKEFNGIQMRRIATIPLGADFAAGAYVVRNVNRGAVFFWDAGKPIYELVDPDGRPFVMQARCIGVDLGMTEDSLATLGERLALPDGWSYRARVLDAELVVDTSATLATVVQDEFENTYTLPY
ncbi:hypothetical protein LBMAG07_15440 [Actinomycetes bacterium]|nr:hypothetical protein LBMAG07_15440 [Actinomycetes bacterium]